MRIMSVRSYIEATAEISRYNCSVCFEADHKIVRLTCPCRKYICLLCIKKVKNCGFCSTDIRVQLPEPIPFRFHCLSNSPQCSLTFPSERDLLSHCAQQCPFMQESSQRELRQALNFECTEGHRLGIAYSSFYSQCPLCSTQQRCKSSCLTCLKEKSKRVMYCVHCRPIPCSKRNCPHSHLLVSSNSHSAVCDRCDNSTRYFSLPVYNDSACNFDICSICFKHLPDELEVQPIKLPEEQEQQEQQGEMEYMEQSD